MKVLTVAALIFIYVAAVFATCKKNCNNTTYNFKAGIIATPITDSIFLNDTLWFTIDESTQLKDTITNSFIDFKNAANLSFVFGIRLVISSQNFIPAAGAFNYIIKKGNLISSVDTSLFREFLVSEEGNRYKLQVGFLPKQAGIFRVLVENSSNVYLRDKSCYKANFAAKFTNADQHFYLGYNIGGDGVYYFKVK